MSTSRPKFFYLLTIVVFLAQLVMPTIARAEGETPTDVPAPEVTAPTDPAPTTPAPVLEPSPNLSPEEAAQSLLPPAATPTPEAAAPDPVLATVGEGISVVVLDENGNPVPLATQEAADALVIGDPRWCPGSQNPAVNSTGCSASFTSLNDLLSALQATYGTYYANLPDGTIWIQTGSFSEAAGSTFINGFSPDANSGHFVTSDDDGVPGSAAAVDTASAHASLTLQGGWDPTSGEIGAASVFSTPIAIFWGGNLTIKNLTVSGAKTYTPGGSYGDYAFQAVVEDNRRDLDNNGYLQLDVMGNKLTKNKTLTVEGLTVTNTTGTKVGGAPGSGNGAGLTADGDVSMNTFVYLNHDKNTGAPTYTATQTNNFDSNKSGTEGTGLKVWTYWSNISLNAVSASANQGSGALVTSQYGDVTVGTAGSSLNNVFDGNGGFGIFATTDSRNICAGDWDGFGAFQRWTNGGDCYNGNWAHSSADLYLNNLQANANGLQGGYFRTGEYGSEDQGVYFQFSNNGVDFNRPVRYGEFSYDNPGNSTTSCVSTGASTGTAYGQNGYGNDCLASNYVSTGRGSITLTGASQFNGNNLTGGSEGLFARTWEGDLSLSGVTADWNNANGAILSAVGGTVEVRYSSFSHNQYDGLNISVDPPAQVLGKILLYHVTASGNLVTVNPSYDSNGFWFDGYTGGWSMGDSDPAEIAVVCSVFNDNAGHGLDLSNPDGTLSVSGGETLNNANGNFTDYLGGNDPLALFSGIDLDCHTAAPVEKTEPPAGVHAGSKIYEQALGNGFQVQSACNDQYQGLQLNLLTGDFVQIPCETGKKGSALTLPSSRLPEKPDGTVLSALTFTVYDRVAGGRSVVSFKLAPGDLAVGYHILCWDGSRWVNVGGHRTEDGYFQAKVSADGIYVLVTN